jgi:hypothetical protein
MLDLSIFIALSSGLLALLTSHLSESQKAKKQMTPRLLLANQPMHLRITVVEDMQESYSPLDI